jgi:hypothetical protein
MTTNWLNQLGDRNPQLLRELRARFQIRSVAATIGITLVAQILIPIFFTSLLPYDRDTGYCLRAIKGVCQETDWVRWWGDICKTLTYIIPYLLCIPGVFALVTDISQETQRGTLNFLRLSPRSSRNILLGKILGVPILGYFSLLLTLPLHLFSALVGGIPLAFILSFYIALIAWAAVLFLAATFVGFSTRNNQASFAGNTQGLMMVVLSAIGILPSVQFWNSLTIWQWFGIKALSLDNAPRLSWFAIAINRGVLLPHIFLGVNLAIVGYWLWLVLQRAFQKPTATLLSKRQSYAIVFYSSVLMLGFFLPGNAGNLGGFERISWLSSSFIYASLTLIFALSTPRQMLFDWLRNRQEAALERRSQPHLPDARRTHLNEWIFGEKSPGVTAIWINLLIIYGVLSLLLPGTLNDFSRTLVGLFLTVTLVANYSLLVQLMLLMETTKRNVWAVGSLVCAIVVPSICAVLPGLNALMGYFTPGLWVMLGSNFKGYYDSPIGVAIFALMIQVLILFLQVSAFRRRLHQMSRQVAPMVSS